MPVLAPVCVCECVRPYGCECVDDCGVFVQERVQTCVAVWASAPVGVPRGGGGPTR